MRRLLESTQHTDNVEIGTSTLIQQYSLKRNFYSFCAIGKDCGIVMGNMQSVCTGPGQFQGGSHVGRTNCCSRNVVVQPTTRGPHPVITVTNSDPVTVTGEVPPVQPTWFDQAKVDFDQLTAMSGRLLKAGFVVVSPLTGSPAVSPTKGSAKRRKKDKKSPKVEEIPESLDATTILNQSMVVTDDGGDENSLSNVLSRMNDANSRRSSSRASTDGDLALEELGPYEPERLLAEITEVDDINDYFQVLEELGSGSFGKVCKAKCTQQCPGLDVVEGDIVALKVLDVAAPLSDDEKSDNKDDPELLGVIEDPTDEEKESAQKDFLHEYEILKRLKDAWKEPTGGGHPNILHLLGAGVTHSRSGFFLITEVCAGPLVFDHIIQGKFLCERTAREISRQILHSVQFCHANRIAHRDIKVCITQIDSL
jgi:hypothetical protein